MSVDGIHSEEKTRPEKLSSLGPNNYCSSCLDRNGYGVQQSELIKQHPRCKTVLDEIRNRPSEDHY